MGCMALGPEIKKIIYTTNTIENLNREIRRVSKSKAAWGSDKALLIQLFLAMDRKKDTWNKVVFGWKAIYRKLTLTHKERFNNYFSEI